MCINHTCKTDVAWRRALALGLTVDANTALHRMTLSSLFDMNVINIIAGYVEPRKLQLEEETNIVDVIVSGDHIFIFTRGNQLKKYSLLTGKMLARAFRPYGMTCTDGNMFYICDGYRIFAYDMNLCLISQLDAPGAAMSAPYMYYVDSIGGIVFVDNSGITKYDPRTKQTEKIEVENVWSFSNEFALYLITRGLDVIKYEGNSGQKVDIDRVGLSDKAYGRNHVLCTWIPNVYKLSCSLNSKSVCGCLTIHGYDPHRVYVGGRRIVVINGKDTFVFDNPFPGAW